MRRNSRKNTLFVTRQEVLTKKGWNQHLGLFARLKAEYMSGDETDRDEEGKKIHPPSYTIAEAEWQSRKFKGLMRKLEDWHNEEWRNPTIDGDYKGGNGPRLRHRSGKIVSVPAPRGLWRNCYSKKWKAKLKPHQVQALEMIDDDYDFTLPSVHGSIDDGEESMESD
ncbi:hypothetical protein PYCCODRAFT_1501532 [Trametes coccinea BRFM310]|uniref:Uncharacterized protein n=1 Tax=Trametes coccinea (strain BRFM310) TaxID=1353009 RepID=A0A1Y2IMX7_TRAC3|nr:hypothetical protein PYCCODRAFT_1501532 [Trametes coccinea BRFM310]